MFYQLSNTAWRQSIEKEFGLLFKYPQLYHPQPIINGLQESILPVVTMARAEEINFAIWGILPEAYSEDWTDFQHAHNTLTIEKDACQDADRWYTEAFEYRRCLIIASGFFTFYLYRGELYPFYVHSGTNQPLSFGGIYNQLEDGFITCAIIVASANPHIRKIQNLERGMPLVVGPGERNMWLDESTLKQQIVNYLCQTPGEELQAHPISKDFFKLTDTRETILQPVHYHELPESLS